MLVCGCGQQTIGSLVVAAKNLNKVVVVVLIMPAIVMEMLLLFTSPSTAIVGSLPGFLLIFISPCPWTGTLSYKLWVLVLLLWALPVYIYIYIKHDNIRLCPQDPPFSSKVVCYKELLIKTTKVPILHSWLTHWLEVVHVHPRQCSKNLRGRV